jgi:ABC-type iron transport system FetAB ATPase subunit
MASLTLKAFETPLLDPFDLHLEAGECISLSGPSGSGKSRLLRAVADLDPNQGEAQVDGQARHSMSGPAWRKLVGLLPAESFWWAERVGDHFPDQGTTLLQALGFGPECLQWEVSRLSSGERQRLALARLLLNQPQVLLLDEPTANLDQVNAESLERLIDDWRREHGCAVIWVSHNPQQQGRIARRHLRIENGALRETTWN